MAPHDLIATARRTVGASPGAPKQADLRRAVSSAYYALFHCLARCCADTLVGKTRAHRSEPAWRQAYRALEHGHARKQCSHQSTIQAFPSGIRTLADQFVDMQRKRERADYEPSTPEGRWIKSDVEEDIENTADAIEDFDTVPLRHRRAFAVFVLLKSRNPRPPAPGTPNRPPQGGCR